MAGREPNTQYSSALSVLFFTGALVSCVLSFAAMKPYRHILFDLDRTLWDFERNSLETLVELFHEFELKKAGIADEDSLISVYQEENERCWKAHREGEMEKDALRQVRFRKTLARFGNHDLTLGERLAGEYIRRTPYKTGLIPNALELLRGIQDHFELHIVTNGFADTQLIKMERAGIENYFREVITSDRAGFQKPDTRFFFYALNRIGAQRQECLVVGDDVEVDMLGAERMGLDRVLYHPAGRDKEEARATFVVKDLMDLHDWLKG